MTQTGALSGTITGPAGFPPPSLTLYQQFGHNGAPLGNWSGTGTTTSAATSIPLIPAGKSCLYATTSINGMYTPTTTYIYPALAAATNVGYTLAAPATQLTPADGAAGVTSTTQFSWQPPAESVSKIFFADGIFYTVGITLFTSGTTATIPVVPEAPLPAHQLSWMVSNFGPLAASRGGDRHCGDHVGQPRIHWVPTSTSSGFRAFKTQ